MIQELMALLPKEINTIAILLGVGGAFVGLILWIGGSRFNRTLVTLISVSTGALIGLQLPSWFGWGLEGWATAILGALVFGISGFVLNKVWVGLGLGIVLAVWAALATFALNPSPLPIPPEGKLDSSKMMITPAKPWSWPAVSAQTTAQTYARDLWNSLAEPVRRVLPFACCVAMLGGLAVSVLWPRVGVVLLYSCMGISLLLGMGIAVLSAARPQWLSVIPRQTSSQFIMLLSLVAFGAILQWRSVPTARRAPQPQGN